VGRIPRNAFKPIAEFSCFLSLLYGKAEGSEELFRHLLENMEEHGCYFFKEGWPRGYSYDYATSLNREDLEFIGGDSEDRFERVLTVCMKKNINLAYGFSSIGFLWSFWSLAESSGDNVLLRLRDDPAFFAEMVLGWAPFDYQVRLLRDESKRILSCWGRQTGKTSTIAVKGVHYAYVNGEATVLIVSPSMRQSMIMFEKLQDFISGNPILVLGISRMTRTVVELLNGSRIIALPCSENLLRGYSAQMVIIDESAFIPEEVIVRVVLPMLSATDGKAVFLSTPWGRDHFFYRAFMNPSYSVHRVRSDQCPLIKPEFLEEMRETMTDEAFRMEYEAEFVEAANSYFPQDLIRGCIDPSDDLMPNLESRVHPGEYYGGCDFGKLQDYSVVSVLRREGESLHLIYLCEFQIGTPYTDVIAHLSRANLRFKFQKVLVDQTGVGEPVIEELRNLGVPVEGLTFTIKTKEELLTTLKIAMEQKRLRIPYHRRLFEQINEQQYTYSKSGHLQFSHPEGSHDDMLWSLALATYVSTIGRERAARLVKAY